MKKIYNLILITVFLVLSHSAISQPLPPPPVDPSAGGTNGTVGSGGAPIGNGTYILIFLAAGYALRKVYVMRKIETAEE